jgi:4-hydroxyphenylpyruvate dioxygenase
MISYTNNTENPDYGRFLGFDHITFWVNNAKRSTFYYTACCDFKQLAYYGLETGYRDVCSHVIRRNDSIFVFQMALNPSQQDMAEHHATQDDGVKDIALTLGDARTI